MTEFSLSPTAVMRMIHVKEGIATKDQRWRFKAKIEQRELCASALMTRHFSITLHHDVSIDRDTLRQGDITSLDRRIVESLSRILTNDIQHELEVAISHIKAGDAGSTLIIIENLLRGLRE